MDDLECLAWPVYDGIFIPGDPSILTRLHDWSRIITGTTPCLIFHGKTMGDHCPPCTVVSYNTKWVMRLMKEQGLQQPDRKRKPRAMLAIEVLRVPAIRSVANIPSQVASTNSLEGAPTTSLDHKEEEEEEAFYKFHQHRMMWCSPTRQCVDPM